MRKLFFPIIFVVLFAVFLTSCGTNNPSDDTSNLNSGSEIVINTDNTVLDDTSSDEQVDTSNSVATEPTDDTSKAEDSNKTSDVNKVTENPNKDTNNTGKDNSTSQKPDEKPDDTSSKNNPTEKPSNNSNDEATLLNIIDRIYNTAEGSVISQFYKDGGRVFQGLITKDTCSSYFGTSLEYDIAMYSELNEEGAAFSLCILKVKDGSDIAKIKVAIKDNANPKKWVCTGAEDVVVESNGSYVALIMGTKKETKSLKTAFLALNLD